ncbi:interferon-induced transmembrane protein 10 isoform X2 [Colius striatus]|uniref:interferon-induced transmembrane protein 10 isoform X2 n=1 Tax=Colius striatus TaxID=57412 RepID=UPI002B1DF134|nr:interferon-induced transmembrane protein 10 isoform X2 [Colius striatus]
MGAPHLRALPASRNPRAEEAEPEAVLSRICSDSPHPSLERGGDLLAGGGNRESHLKSRRDEDSAEKTPNFPTHTFNSAPLPPPLSKRAGGRGAGPLCRTESRSAVPQPAARSRPAAGQRAGARPGGQTDRRTEGRGVTARIAGNSPGTPRLLPTVSLCFHFFLFFCVQFTPPLVTAGHAGQRAAAGEGRCPLLCPRRGAGAGGSSATRRLRGPRV